MSGHVVGSSPLALVSFLTRRSRAPVSCLMPTCVLSYYGYSEMRSRIPKPGPYVVRAVVLQAHSDAKV